MIDLRSTAKSVGWSSDEVLEYLKNLRAGDILRQGSPMESGGLTNRQVSRNGLRSTAKSPWLKTSLSSE